MKSSSQAAATTSLELRGGGAPYRLLVRLPGISMKASPSGGMSSSRESQPLALKSWQRWMVSRNRSTDSSAQAPIQKIMPAGPTKPPRNTAP
jgi:hypothetical protein